MKVLHTHPELIIIFSIAGILSYVHIIAGAIAFCVNTGYAAWQWYKDYKKDKNEKPK